MTKKIKPIENKKLMTGKEWYERFVGGTGLCGVIGKCYYKHDGSFSTPRKLKAVDVLEAAKRASGVDT